MGLGDYSARLRVSLLGPHLPLDPVSYKNLYLLYRATVPLLGTTVLAVLSHRHTEATRYLSLPLTIQTSRALAKQPTFQSRSLPYALAGRLPQTPSSTNMFRLSSASLPALYILLDTASASPLPMQLTKRNMTTGAKAGLGIGIAVAIVLVACIATFFVIHLRRQAHNRQINHERAVLAGEKLPDGTDKPDKFAPEPEVTGMPRRNKSVKDRLMGPLYRGSMIEMPPVPKKARIGGSNRQSTMTLGDGESFLNKPWAGTENSPRPSFSSKRATRMMMMM